MGGRFWDLTPFSETFSKNYLLPPTSTTTLHFGRKVMKLDSRVFCLCSMDSEGASATEWKKYWMRSGGVPSVVLRVPAPAPPAPLSCGVPAFLLRVPPRRFAVCAALGLAPLLPCHCYSWGRANPFWSVSVQRRAAVSEGATATEWKKNWMRCVWWPPAKGPCPGIATATVCARLLLLRVPAPARRLRYRFCARPAHSCYFRDRANPFWSVSLQRRRFRVGLDGTGGFGLLWTVVDGLNGKMSVSPPTFCFAVSFAHSPVALTE